MARDNKRAKLSHSTNSPYLDPPWPQVDTIVQQKILELLCALLKPVGKYRQMHAERSKGKRSRRRKGKKNKETGKQNIAPIPQAPELMDHITIGFNSTLRLLQRQSRQAGCPLSDAEDLTSDKRITAVFVCTSTLPAMLTSSIPVLVTAASGSPDTMSEVRLVPLPPDAEDRLADALYQPRVGFVGLLRDVFGAKQLLEFVREKVVPVKLPWLQGPAEVKYKPVKVQSCLF